MANEDSRVLEGYPIICFAPNDWWGMNPSCATHIMTRLADLNPVLFVNPFSSDMSAGIRRGIGVRIWRKVKSLFKVLRHPRKNLWIFSPFFVPFQGRSWIDRLNNFLLRFQFYFVRKSLGFQRPIVWVENLRSADLIHWMNPALVVYHISDLFTHCTYTARQDVLRQRDEQIVKASDLIICVSDLLHQRYSARHANVHYIPHGVDYEKFRQAAQSHNILPELREIPRPIAGYFGTMTANNDIELLLFCARNLPKVSFVFAGQITGGDYSELLALPNVYHLGRLAYENIPSLCAGFDVCMLQWKVTEWIRNCNPLKLQEYMASGHPIVSVPIREIEDNYSSLVSVASDKEQFCQAILWELANDTSERSLKRIDIAKNHSWIQHVNRISELIIQAVAGKNQYQ